MGKEFLICVFFLVKNWFWIQTDVYKGMKHIEKNTVN